MATSKSEQWRVYIVVDEDESLEKVYRISPNTTLMQLMRVWKNEFKLYGNWLFVSEKGSPITQDWLTIERMEETRPNSKIITLKAELFDKTISEVFVLLNEKCRQLKLKPQQKLIEVAWPLTSMPVAIECNGAPLNLLNAAQGTIFPDKAIIYESLRSISVKLSSGGIKIIQMPSDSMVLQLMERVSAYETGNFSLKYLGRYLHTQERINVLTKTVKVMTADFVVHFDDCRVRWKTKREPMVFPDFLSELSVKGNMDKEKLENMKFICIGCQRRIWNSEDDTQILPIKCCKEMSRTLKAVSPSNEKTNAKTNDGNQSILSFYEHLLRMKNSRAEDSRNLCSEMKEKCLEQRWDYNLITEWGDRLQRSFSDLEDKIKILEGRIEAWKIKNTESEEAIEILKTTNTISEEENKTLKEEIMKFEEEIVKLESENRKSETKIRELHDQSNKLQKEIGVKLFIFYDSEDFTPLRRPEVEQQGKYWTITGCYIKCRVRGIPPGWTTFEALRDVLAPLFANKNEIREISQRRGTVHGRTVVRVTSYDKDEAHKGSSSPYCDVDTGEQFSWEEAGKPTVQNWKPGDWILCGGWRRVVLTIFK